MTRTPDTEGAIEYRLSGVPGAPRAVVVLRTSPAATIDPFPPTTVERDIQLLLVHVDDADLDDPPTSRAETAGEATAASLVALIEREIGAVAFGLVAEREAGAVGIAVAAALADRVDRLALIAVPAPASALERDLRGATLARVRAAALVVVAEDEPGADASAADWFRETLADARTLTVAADALTSGDGRLGLVDVWEPVLAHTAPDAGRH